VRLRRLQVRRSVPHRLDRAVAFVNAAIATIIVIKAARPPATQPP
jgi:hypothetical protein